MTLRGTLADISVASLLTTFSRCLCTGKLLISTSNKRTILSYRLGNLFHAILTDSERAQPLVGEDVIHNLWEWTNGQFHFFPSNLPDDHIENIHRPISRIVHERATNRSEVSTELHTEVYIRTTGTMVDYGMPIHLSGDEWHVLALIGEGITLQELAARRGWTIEAVQKVLAHLESLGMITFEDALATEAIPRTKQSQLLRSVMAYALKA